MGMLARSAFAPRRKNAPRPAEKSAPGYLKWLRGRPCMLEGHRLGGCGEADPPRKSPVEAAHVDHAGGKGMATKVADRYAIPLCQRHHDEQSGKIGPFSKRGGWRSFETKYGFDAETRSGFYWRAWPGRKAWEAKNA